MATATDTPVVQLGDIVRVVNHGSKPLVLQWDSKKFVIPANGEGFASFEAVKLYFGDPRSLEGMQTLRDEKGLVSFVPDRATEVRRLRQLHGLLMGDETTITDEELEKLPQVELYDLSGNRIYTVLDDPSGERIKPYTPTSFDQTQLMALIQRQQQHIDFLMSRVADKEAVDSTAKSESPDAGLAAQVDHVIQSEDDIPTDEFTPGGTGEGDGTVSTELEPPVNELPDNEG